MLSATKIPLYPDTDQQQKLAMQFGCARFVWNKAFAMKSAAWRERKKSLSCSIIKSMLPVWKKGGYPWVKDADSQGMPEVIRHLDRAYLNFFDKRGKHRYSRRSTAPDKASTIRSGSNSMVPCCTCPKSDG
jgi:putative transposase